MKVANIRDRVRQIVSDTLSIYEGQIRDCDNLFDDLHTKPRQLASLMMGIEEKFGGHLTDTALARIDTVGDIVHYI